MPHTEAVQKRLPYRQIRLILCDTAKRIVLHRTKTQDAFWVLPETWVYAGEAYEDAIERVLKTELSIQEWVSFNIIAKEYTKHEYSILFIIYLDYKHSEDLGNNFLTLDYDELQGLSIHFSDMLCPKLHNLITKDILSTVLKTCALT